MKIEIGKTDEGWEVRANGQTDDAIITCRSRHETACDAAREAAGLLRVWATTEGECKPMKSLWLVVGHSMPPDDFARVASGATRLEAVIEVAKAMKLSWYSSHDVHDDHQHITVGNVRPSDGWKQPNYFWVVACSPLEFGVNMVEEDAWIWHEDEIRHAPGADEGGGGR